MCVHVHVCIKFCATLSSVQIQESTTTVKIFNSSNNTKVFPFIIIPSSLPSLTPGNLLSPISKTVNSEMLCKLNHTVGNFLILAFFTPHNSLELNPSCCLYQCTRMLACFSHVWLCATQWTVARQAPLSMGFFRQESWNGLSFPPPGNLPDTDQTHVSYVLGIWQAGSLPLSPLGC